MAKIIKIQDNKILIGIEDGSMEEANMEDANFTPQVGDEVEIFKNDTKVVVLKKENKNDTQINQEKRLENTAFKVEDEYNIQLKQKNTNDKILKTDRKLIQFFLLTAVTFGIYGIVYWVQFVNDINTVSEQRHAKETPHFIIMLLLSCITCNIYMFVWHHNLANKIAEEAKIRGIDVKFSATTFWLWGILGSVIVIGPFVYLNRLMNAMNLICENYNQRGQ